MYAEDLKFHELEKALNAEFSNHSCSFTRITWSEHLKRIMRVSLSSLGNCVRKSC